jgi:serine/threonine-protein kinase
MPSYADILLGRMLLREGSVTPQALFQALVEVKAALTKGSELALAEALGRRRIVFPDVLERARASQAHAQHLEEEKAFARLVVEEGLAPPETVRALVEESRAQGFREGLGPMMVRRAILSDAQAGKLFMRRQMALAEARTRREKVFAEGLAGLGASFTKEHEQRILELFDATGSTSDKTPSKSLGSSTWVTRSPLAAPPPPPPAPPPPKAPPPKSSDPKKNARPVGSQRDLMDSTVADTGTVSQGTDKAFTLASARADDSAAKQLAPEDCPIYGYEIVKELGKGAMGVVYKARHIFTDRMVALKILPLKLARDSHYLERFKREAIAAMRLQHDNVVRAYDFGGSEEYYYLALEFVEGETLEKRLDRETRLPERDALDFVRQVALALDEASKQGVVHRDVKPENIMVTKQGVAKLCDFGIVKLLDRDEGAVTVAGTTVGTPFYIAPEQARGEEELDTRSDLYSLGITLFHLVTGKVPFTGKSQGAILVRHILEEVPDPRSFEPLVSEGCAAIVKKMTRKKREDRYATAKAVADDIEKLLAVSSAGR